MVDTEFTLLGDAVWLDFINTARGRVPSPPDLLPDDSSVERWAIAQCLQPQNGDCPALELVLRFRERLSELAEALHAGLQPPAAAIAAINEQLALSGGAHQLTRVGG